jgi:signal transduction histidine kinase
MVVPDRREPVGVLLADDLPEIRMLVGKMLDADGRFRVLAETTEGASTLEALDLYRPDALILDLAMPNMDGLEILPEVQKRAPNTKVLVLSGFDAGQMAPIARQRGAHDYVEKGADLRELVRRLALLFPELPDPEVTDERPVETPPLPADGDSIAEVMSVLIHELQAPVAVMEGFAIALGHAVEREDPQTILETSEAIRRSARTLRSLIRSFSDARLLDTGMLSLTTRPTDLVPLVRGTVEDMSTITRGHPIAIEATGEVEAEIDSVRFRQVITNLLSNAAKYSPNETPIAIGVEDDDSVAKISVTDRGPGIPPKRLHELFQKFSRLDAKGSGTGLGLYISRGIARAHGGDLTVEPNPGTGCKFILTLPLEGQARG